MQKRKWLGVVGFLLLFYLIIWGFFKLMFSSLGTDSGDRRQTPPVIILQITSSQGAKTEELTDWLNPDKEAGLTVINLVEFMEKPVSAGTTLIIPPLTATEQWIFAGLTTLIRLGEWADSGASVLTFDPFPRADTATKNGEKITLAEGFYTVDFAGFNASAVLWFDRQQMGLNPQKGAAVKATLTIGDRQLPVIWEIKARKGRLTTCLARPQATPGAAELLRQLVSGLTLQPGSVTSRITPMPFDTAMAAVVNHHLASLLTDNQADQINSITWLAQHRYPPARYAILPALFSQNQLVAMAAAEALVKLEAINALEAIAAATRIQPVEVRPVLERAGQKIVGIRDGRLKEKNRHRR